MTDGIKDFPLSLDDPIEPALARSLFPFNDTASYALEQLTYRQFRDLLFQAFGDHPEFEYRMSVLYAGVADKARANLDGS